MFYLAALLYLAIVYKLSDETDEEVQNKGGRAYVDTAGGW